MDEFLTASESLPESAGGEELLQPRSGVDVMRRRHESLRGRNWTASARAMVASGALMVRIGGAGPAPGHSHTSGLAPFSAVSIGFDLAMGT